MHNTDGSRYDVALLQDDMAARGWMQVDLARKAKVSHMSVSRFLTGQRQTARMALKLAKAFGHPVTRYLISSRQEAAAS
jgi:plasmid maintenance system antidote protein VapI